MMILSPLNDVVYEQAQKDIAYAKLFPYILADFVTRADLQAALLPANLIANTVVQVGPTGTGTGLGPVTAVYKGAVHAPGSTALAAKQEAIKNGGSAATAAAIGL